MADLDALRRAGRDRGDLQRPRPAAPAWPSHRARRPSGPLRPARRSRLDRRRAPRAAWSAWAWTSSASGRYDEVSIDGIAAAAASRRACSTTTSRASATSTSRVVRGAAELEATMIEAPATPEEGLVAGLDRYLDYVRSTPLLRRRAGPARRQRPDGRDRRGRAPRDGRPHPRQPRPPRRAGRVDARRADRGWGYRLPRRREPFDYYARRTTRRAARLRRDAPGRGHGGYRRRGHRGLVLQVRPARWGRSSARRMPAANWAKAFAHPCSRRPPRGLDRDAVLEQVYVRRVRPLARASSRVSRSLIVHARQCLFACPATITSKPRSFR